MMQYRLNYSFTIPRKIPRSFGVDTTCSCLFKDIKCFCATNPWGLSLVDLLDTVCQIVSSVYLPLDPSFGTLYEFKLKSISSQFFLCKKVSNLSKLAKTYQTIVQVDTLETNKNLLNYSG